jgi:FkbM family methyltransferase
MKQVDGWWVADGAEWSAEVRAAKVAQVGYVSGFVASRGLALCAGAWNGIVPAELAKSFARVVALEPDPENYVCAMLNLYAAPWSPVRIDHAMLAERAGVGVLLSAADGLQHIATQAELETASDGDTNTVPTLRIDDLCLDYCDLMLLDVEGYELAVLEGARETLGLCRPTLMVEENAICSRYGRERGQLAKWLAAEFCYELVGEWTTLPPDVQADGFRGSDLIFQRRAP